jgi:hypothetical protein
MFKWIKIPKAIALLAFLLPWMTVSCSGTAVVSATGFGLAFGKFTSEMANAGTNPGDGKSNILLILAIVVIAAGLIVSFLRVRQAALVTLATSVAGIVLILAGTWRYSKSAMLAEMKKAGEAKPDNPFAGGNLFGRDPAETAAAMIRIDWHFGYWLTLAALVVAGVTAWLAFTGRERAFADSVRNAMAGGGGAAPEPLAVVTCPSCGRSYPASTHFCPEDGTALS